MVTQILDKLKRVYGDDVGQTTYNKLITKIGNQFASEPDEIALSEEDIILITYGDMVQDEAHPPLKVLHDFLADTAKPQINSVHILPFYPYSSDDGFSVIDYKAVDPALGDWADVRNMSDDFRLMFDAVFNHISAHSEWFAAFKRGEAPYTDYFVTVPPETDLSAVVRPRALPLLTPVETADGLKHVWTTFSDDQIDVNFANPDVLLELIDILLFYVDQGASLIRLDAIAFAWKEIGTSSIHHEKTHLIVQLMRDVLDVVAPDTIIITETNVPHDENISYFGDGQNEAQMVYNFSLPPLTLHTLATGNSEALTKWAKTLQPVGDKTTYFNFTSSHDGVGMRPATGLLTPDEIQNLVDLAQSHGGDVSFKNNSDGTKSPYELNITYFDAITDPKITAENPELAVKRFMVSQAIALAMQGVPGIYFHCLYGSRNWKEGVEQTGRLRTINRQKLNVDTLREELNAVGSIRQQVFENYMALLKIRTQEMAFHPLASQTIHDYGSGVFVVERISQDGTERVLAIHNVTDEEHTIDISSLDTTWQNLMGDTAITATIVLQPYQILWLKQG